MKIQLAMISLVACLGLGFSVDTAVWYKSSQGVYESDIRNIFIDPTDDVVIYAGTSKALYKSINEGKSYRMILRPSGERSGINDVYILPDQPEIIYAATDVGLYESLNEGKSWDRIYYSSQIGARICLSVFFYDNTIYLGTQKGLFSRNFQEISWRKIKESIGNRPVYSIIGSENFLYFETGQKIFRWDEQTKRMKNVFSMGLRGGSELGGLLEGELATADDRPIRSLVSLRLKKSFLFIGSNKGIYVSYDYGEQWKPLSADQLSFNELTDLLVLEKNCLNMSIECVDLLAGTKKGVFFLNNGKWVPIYKGMETNGVAHLARNMRGTIYAATTRGIFYLPIEKALPSFDNFKNPNIAAFDYEPGIRDVHQWAIDYAEVSHKKIENWRRQAQRKAWLPSLDIGIDGDKDWGSSDSIWGSYSSGGQHYVGPDDKSSGEDLGWDVSLSWDLADLVWSTDQTTIDSRSKMMVELREDILNEVTRLYFERRRVQMELAFNNSLEWTLKIDKEMRIAELTALIDALTGGEFSGRIANNN